MNELARPARTPRRARIVVAGTNEAGTWGALRIGDRRVVELAWDRLGNVAHERWFDARGRAHGYELERYPDGAVAYRARWVHGVLEGPATQLDEAGSMLVRSRFVRGAGLDVWVACGRVAEVREVRRSRPHGIERWGDPCFPDEERTFIRGLPSGVMRRWEGEALAPGYPRFFVDGAEVSRGAYLRSRRRRPELPPIRASDDQRARVLPPGFSRVWLRADVRARLCDGAHSREARQRGADAGMQEQSP